MKRRNLLIFLIILSCGSGIFLAVNAVILDDSPRYSVIEKDGTEVDQYALGDKIELAESTITIHDLLPSDIDNEVILDTEFDAEETKVFCAYYSIYYGSNDQLDIQSGIRIQNDEIILSCTERKDYT